MRVLLMVALTFGIGIQRPNTTSNVQQTQPSIERTESKLEVSIVLSERRYRANEQLKMLVMLKNTGKREVYVLGTLEWGHSASFLFHILDASGKEIRPRAFPDDQTLVPRGDNSAFVKLLPSHFIGTDFYAPLNLLGLDRPGKYSIYVEYHPPISSADTELKPFWGSKNQPIRSNVASFEAVR